MLRSGKRFTKAAFRGLPDTWRSHAADRTGIVSRGRLLAYLNPAQPEPPPEENGSRAQAARGRGKPPRRVLDRPDLQPLLPISSGNE
jgi:hypothetical protein